MRISVAICTWNRARSLTRTLESVAIARTRARAAIEIIIVNNNSTDDTDVVIERFAKGIPLLRVFEPTPGLSHARNAAIEAASGDYIVWTDDDVCADPGWLMAYEGAFDAHPEASFFGGPIIPRFDGTPPRWLATAWPTVGEAYAARDLGNSPLLFTPDLMPYGANFAVRTAEQQVRRFDPRFGRRPGDYWLVGEESRMLLQLFADGKSGWWVPDARVEHCIPPDRQTTAYIEQYFAGLGRSEMIGGPHRDSWLLLGRPLRIWRDWIKWEMRYPWLRATRSPEAWLPKLAARSRARGWLQEVLPILPAGPILRDDSSIAE